MADCILGSIFGKISVYWFLNLILHGARLLALKLGVAEFAIKRMEVADGFPEARGGNIETVYRALLEAGIEITPENGGVLVCV